jgi:hypothetical protein
MRIFASNLCDSKEHSHTGALTARLIYVKFASYELRSENQIVKNYINFYIFSFAMLHIFLKWNSTQQRGAC